MRIETGIDIVYIPRMNRLLQNKEFLKRTFHERELQPLTAEHLAGTFAAKEAFFKALQEKPRWLEIEVKKGGTAPEIVLSPALQKRIVSVSVSISHDKEYAVAQVVVMQ